MEILHLRAIESSLLHILVDMLAAFAVSKNINFSGFAVSSHLGHPFAGIGVLAEPERYRETNFKKSIELLELLVLFALSSNKKCFICICKKYLAAG